MAEASAPAEGGPRIAAAEGRLTAVQNGQVYTNPKGVFSWDRYGVEEALQLQWVANLLHPELFNIDIRTQVKDFYETFLHYTLTDEQVELILNAEAPQ